MSLSLIIIMPTFQKSWQIVVRYFLANYSQTQNVGIYSCEGLFSESELHSVKI